MHKYKIIEKKEDIKDSVIEKSGVKIKITLGDMETQYKRVLKIKEEMEAQKLVDEAQVTNCETNYPGIEDATEEDEKRAIALTLRKGNLQEIKELEAKLKEIDEACVEYVEEIAEIKKQINEQLNEQ